MTPRALLSLSFLLCAPPAIAAPLALTLPHGAVETAHTADAFAALRLPVGPWSAGRIPMVDLKGAVEQTAWRIVSPATNSLTLVGDLSAQLQASGFHLIYDCANDDCGGFDFRYAAPILPEPEMHVDLADFHYQALIRGQGAEADYAALLTSRAGDTGFAQLSLVRQSDHPTPEPALTAPVTSEETAPEPAAISAAPDLPLATALDTQGQAALEDLEFASGSASLDAGAFASLAAIASYLTDHPDRTILIVGHTDVSGTLASNLTLSRARAASVVERLVNQYGVRADQLLAEGAGPLAPRTTNLSSEGRQKNRRVEAVLASTQ